MNVLSLFDGMSCGQQALERAGIKVSNYYASEIDKYAIQVTQHNYPNTIQLGSVVNVNGYDLPKIDLLIGGSPCQSFSFAGKRKGMATKCETEILTLDNYLQLKAEGYEFEGQSYLFWEYMRLLKEVKPKYFLLENVMMGEKWERILSKAIGVNPIEINSALVSAQNRRRLYWTNIGMEAAGLFGDLESIIKQPKDKGILLKDILESEVADKYFLSDKMINCLDKRKGTTYDTFYPADIDGKGRTINSRLAKMGPADNYITVHNTMPRSSTTGKGGTGPLSRNDGKTYCLDTGNTNAVEIKCVAMRGRNPENPKSREAGLNTEQMIEPRFDGKTNCLTSVQKDNLVMQLNTSKESNGSQPYQQNRVYDANGISCALDTRSDQKNVYINNKIRRLTPTECERLQTVRDNEISCIFTLCLDQVKSYVYAVQLNPKLQKIVSNVDQSELNEFAKSVIQNMSANHQLIKNTVQQNADMPIQTQIEKCTNLNLQGKNTIARNVINNAMYNYQMGEEDFVLQNAFINITEGKITHYGKAELHLKDKNSTVQKNGNQPLKLFGKEIMLLVKYASAETIVNQDMSSISTILSLLNIKDIEQMLAIFYLFAKNATTGFTQSTTNQKSISVNFSIKNGYTAIVSDTQRYRMLGNGWTVEVIKHIFSYIK